jgi:hypothetical protein
MGCRRNEMGPLAWMTIMMTRRLVQWRDGMRESGRWKGRGWKNDDNNNDDDFGSSVSCMKNL